MIDRMTFSRLTLLIAAPALVGGFAGPCCVVRPRMLIPRMLVGEEKALADEAEVWRLRETMIRNTFGMLVNFKEDEREEVEARAANPRDTAEATRSAFVASASAVVIGAFVLRLGGRAALVSLLGLDIVADLGIGDSIDQVIQFAEALGGWAVVAFVAAWVVAKVFLIDVISIALAFSSGVLFGGVIPGALLSATGATVGSFVAFQLSRTLLQVRPAELGL